MAEDDVAIRVGDVSKNFRLPHERVGSVKSIFTHLVSYISNKRSYETQHALRDVSLEIKKGEFFGIVGRNGSGKSTLLKIIAGIYQPTKGKVMVNGKLVPFIELGVGFNPELTGRQNVYLNGALLGFSEKEIDGQYEDIVDFAELKQFMDQKLKNYSSGMQVRLAFSMAIRAKADILLIDEVLAVGDADFQRKCFDYFKKLKKQQKTVVFVSHNMDAIREFCDRAILIENGKLIAEGPASKIAADYAHIFTASSSDENVHTNSKRWGNKQATITHTSAQYTQSNNIPVLTIKIKIHAKSNVDNPVIGFIIKNAVGVPILGMNTILKHHNIGLLQLGQGVTTKWSVPDIFGDGNYFVDVAVHAPSGTPVYDWWEEATTFKVTKDSRTAYIVEPSIDLEVSK